MKRLAIYLFALTLVLAAGASYAKEDAVKPSMVSVSDVVQQHDIVNVLIHDNIGLTVEAVDLVMTEFIINDVEVVAREGVFHPPTLNGNILAIKTNNTPTRNLKFTAYQPKGYRWQESYSSLCNESLSAIG